MPAAVLVICCHSLQQSQPLRLASACHAEPFLHQI
jgi:hypothetical protein